MDMGNGGLSADDFNILLALRLLRLNDDSPTKVILERFHAILKAEPRAQIPPQVQYAEEM